MTPFASVFAVALVVGQAASQPSTRPMCPPPAVRAADGPSLPEVLQAVSVTIKAGQAEGSGVVVTRADTNYIWTAAHVVAGNRTERTVVDPVTGIRRTIVEFKDVGVIQSLYEGGRKVGQLEMLAEVLKYSGANHGEDLALLRIRKRNFIRESASFHSGTDIPAPGTDLLHVGSLQGQLGSNSVTDGIVSQIGRLHEGKVYDQTTVTAFPGSSGGGVFLKANGLYVGMITRGAGETFNLMVPIRRIKTWATRVGIGFALDPTAPIPDLTNMPVEDTGRTFQSPVPASQPQPGQPG